MSNVQVQPQVHADRPMCLAEMTLPEIEDGVSSLSDSISQDQLLSWLVLSSALLSRAKQIRSVVEGVAVGWISAHGAFESGSLTYSVGKQKQVKCRDVVGCFKALLEACDGDIDEVCRLLTSDPYRYGACRHRLNDEQWDRVFATEWQNKLVLKQTDTRFLPHPACKTIAPKP